jgi:predicted TIM-barrel fold metal-dependent hydrolase
MLDAPDWTRDGKKRLEFNLAHGVGRAVLFPTFMLAGGTFQPHVSAAACAVYNDWLQDEYCAGSGGRLIPVAALPIIDVEASVAEVKRCAERGYQAVFIRTNSVHGTKYSERKFDAVWQAITDTGLKLGLHPLPVWDQDGTSRGFKLRDIMAASALGFPLDMMHTLYDMMAGGVFDRFPRMPTMILEAGCGWIPSMFERWEEHMKMFGRVKAPDWKSKPMDIFLRQMMVTVEAARRSTSTSRSSTCRRRTSRSRRTGRTTTARRPARGLQQGHARRQGRGRPHARDRHARALVPLALTRGVRARRERRERPDHTALVCGDRRLTYGALARLVNRTAHALARAGVGAGGRVALMLPNCIEFFAGHERRRDARRARRARSTTAGAATSWPTCSKTPRPTRS